MTIDKLILQSHFDSSSIQLALDGGSVPHGYPCFTLSVTCPILSGMRQHSAAWLEIEPDLNFKRTDPENTNACLVTL